MKQYKYLIIGGGMAADAAVKGIRKVDNKGSIGVISREADPPYKRPPLSKDLWTKDKSPEDIGCATGAAGAEIILNRRIVSLDTDKQEAVDDRGTTTRYERLLLATGGSPKHLPFQDVDLIYYRTLEDYRRLRDLTQSGNRIAILGGGFIGTEIAAALTTVGNPVTMIFPESGIGGLVFPPEFSAALTQYYADRGVTILSGCKPSAITIAKSEYTLHVENGYSFSANGVVAGVGITPNTQLAEAAGLDVDNGITVNEQLCTANPAVFAAGDAANFYNPALDCRLRVEHEDNALKTGEIAGRNMAGEQQIYRHLPYFYSDLFDVGYEAVGNTDSSLDVVTDLTDPRAQGCFFYLRSGRVRGVVFWNLFDKHEAGRELIAARDQHTKDGLLAWAKDIVSK